MGIIPHRHKVTRKGRRQTQKTYRKANQKKPKDNRYQLAAKTSEIFILRKI